MFPVRKGWWRDGTALGTLILLPLLFFWKILLTNQILAGLDVFAYFYPYREFASQALREARLPLWNPHLFMGAPLLANSQAAVLYPLHWPLAWLPVPKQIAWSIGLHIALAASGAYLFFRNTTRLRRTSAWLAAAVFAYSGFLGAQAEHLNQLNVSAWLPWFLLCLESACGSARNRWPSLLLGGLVVSLMLLAGHTQALYIVLFGSALYIVVTGLIPQNALNWRAGLRALNWRGAFRHLVVFGAVTLLGAALAAGQLVPTLELSRLSVRAGGLSYRDAIAFSLSPDLLIKALLPPLGWQLPFSEYVAYVGLTGLGLGGIGAWAMLRHGRRGDGATSDLDPRRSRLALLVLCGTGLFLSLGGYNPIYYVLFRMAPGFDLFRAPARWLLLYAFGMAALVGIGLETLVFKLRAAALGRLWNRSRTAGPRRQQASERALQHRFSAQRRFAAVGLFIAILLVAELLLARRQLAYNNPTAPVAYDSDRTAPSHLLADGGSEPFRFLSISDIGFDPGDMTDLSAMYAGELSDRGIYDLIVATKMKEVLAYNLPLHFGIDSVDGYDGGLLPTTAYVRLEHLFLPEDLIWPDGRLRQQLQEIPPRNLLSLLNVKYVITDKLQDAWVDDVFYDLQHTAHIDSLTLTELPSFPTTHVGVVSHLLEASSLRHGAPVAEIAIDCAGDITYESTLRAGIDTAEGRFDVGGVSHKLPALARQQVVDGQSVHDFVTVLGLGHACQPQAIHFRSLLPPDGAASMALRGLTLIDERTGACSSVSVEPAYMLVHSGDVKIYENLEVLPRAFVAHRARYSPGDRETIELLRDPDFEPSQEVILHQQGAVLRAIQGGAEVTIASYRPERVEVHAQLEAPGYLVLTDSYYPGWQVLVDGQPAELLRADLYFRSVSLEAGSHEVVFQYRPATLRWGLGLSAFAFLVWSLSFCAFAVRHIGRKPQSSVECGGE